MSQKLDYSKLYEEIYEQEKLLQFDRFTNHMAFEIGLMLKNKAEREERQIVIDIERQNQKLFHYAFENTCNDNDYWISAKNRYVNHFFHSSLLYSLRIKETGKTVEEMYHLNSFDFIPCGGAFPIIIKSVGVVGTITVSNMSEEDDHRYVVEVLKEYLFKENI
jgi:Uncharacterized conserved protein